MQTAHHHQPEAQGSVYPWCILIWTGPHLLWITLHIDTFTTNSPPETTLLLMAWITLPSQITVHLQPTKAPLMHYLLCSCVYLRHQSYTPNVSILILNVNHQLASTCRQFRFLSPLTMHVILLPLFCRKYQQTWENFRATCHDQRCCCSCRQLQPSHRVILPHSCVCLFACGGIQSDQPNI